MSLDYDFNSSDLDEFLVEYVDGTMDPVVREAFEEFLRVYPEVAEQVDCLASIRSQLCRLGDKCRCHAPPGFQARLKEQLLEETSRSDTVIAEAWLPHLNVVALAFSLTLLVLAVGLSASSPTYDSVEVASTELDERSVPLEPTRFSTREKPTPDFYSSIAISRDSYWNVSHTHPGSGEIHVEAAFDRPVLLSVRRDIVAMRPVFHRPLQAYTLP